MSASQPVEYKEGVEAITGEWHIKDVPGPVELLVQGGEVRSKQPRFGGQPIVGKPREGAKHFEMDVQMGGFPMTAAMTTRQQQKVLEFSNGGLWSKGSPFKAAAANAASQGIPMSEVRKHNTKDSAWVVLHGKVYDLTAFLADHPGGEQVVLDWAGKDATKFWSAIHKQAWIQEYTKPEWCLGPLGPEPVVPVNEELKKAQDEIKTLKAELVRITAAPTKPSKGLQDALTATKAAQVAPQAMSLPAEAEECSRLELKGKRVVVIGHGPVGHDFIVKLVGMVGDGALDITVVGEEPRMAYDRVHLTEYFEHRDASKLSMCDKKWFTDHKVTLQTSVRAEKIDRDGCSITLRDVKSNSTQELPYDACVLCTGSYPFVPPPEELEQ